MIIWVLAVKQCARCGKDHAEVGMFPLSRPVVDDAGGVVGTHWARCPVNGEPILMTFDATPSPMGARP